MKNLVFVAFAARPVPPAVATTRDDCDIDTIDAYLQMRECSKPVGSAIERRCMPGNSARSPLSRSGQRDCGAITSINCLSMHNPEYILCGTIG